jgi:hypothetical protein
MKNKFTKEQEKEIILRYINGEKSTDLAKEFKCTYSTILNVIKRNGEKSKSKSEAHVIHHCNENYFTIIDSEDKAYFLGLLYADGCIHNTQPRFLISLQEEDKHILELFKEKIEYTGYLYLRSSEIRKNQYSLEITSEKLKEDLINLGCVSKKSLILQFPNEMQVPIELIHHFIRGVFDGDGSVGVTTRLIKGKEYKEQFIQFIGSNNFIDGLCKQLDFLNRFTISSVNNGNNKQIAIKSKLDFIQMYEFLYKDATIYLHRKYNKFQDILKYLNDKPYYYSGEQIAQYSKENELIKIWNNLDEICNSDLKVRRDSILKCIKGITKTTGNFIWKLYK